jgi:hypothetical protein
MFSISLPDDLKFGEFQQELFLSVSLKEYGCFPVGRVTFQIDNLSGSETGMFNGHPHLYFSRIISLKTG